MLRLGVESSEIDTRFGQRAKRENFLGHVFVTSWTRGEDKPGWIIEPKPGRYDVTITYGAGSGSAKNPYVITAGDSKLEGTVESTSNALVFRPFKIGTIDLKSGRQTLAIGGPEKGRGPNISLESIVLTPAQ